MAVEFDSSRAALLRDYFEKRRADLLGMTRSLVEQESPSGDIEGSRAVVDLLAEAARGIEGVEEVERLAAAGCGEHLRVRAFGGDTESAPLLLLGHTDTVHPRGSTRERPWREDDGRIYAPGI